MYAPIFSPRLVPFCPPRTWFFYFFETFFGLGIVVCPFLLLFSSSWPSALSNNLIAPNHVFSLPSAGPRFKPRPGGKPILLFSPLRPLRGLPPPPKLAAREIFPATRANIPPSLFFPPSIFLFFFDNAPGSLAFSCAVISRGVLLSRGLTPSNSGTAATLGFFPSSHVSFWWFHTQRIDSFHNTPRRLKFLSHIWFWFFFCTRLRDWRRFCLSPFWYTGRFIRGNLIPFSFFPTWPRVCKETWAWIWGINYFSNCLFPRFRLFPGPPPLFFTGLRSVVPRTWVPRLRKACGVETCLSFGRLWPGETFFLVFFRR